MSEKGNHIWPAYVDMMTVLLMVYLLLALLFQVVVATSKTAINQVEADELAKAEAGKQGQEQIMPQQPPKKEQQASAAGEQASNSAENQDMTLVTITPTELAQKQGDLRLRLEARRNYLNASEIQTVKTWVEEHRSEIASKGIRLYSVAPNSNNVQVGSLLKVQFDRALSVMSAVNGSGISLESISYDNEIIQDATEDFVILRVRKDAPKP
ncbi:hypothetical protein WJT86_05395 [Microvirga sp. W0021]|uniref:Uncharacterized protein n=1 Tax=Hohaiivirga grylli TaxID=3133970 RepID=A0ABV0BHP4_9HYPH